MNQDTIIKHGFQPFFKTIDNPQVNVNVGTVHLRKWQNEFAEEYLSLDNKNAIVTAPGGAGKSKAVSFVTYQFLVENPNKKVIIAAPQKGIGGNFSTLVEFNNHNNPFTWMVEASHNLCTGNNNVEGKINALKQFIFSPTIPRVCDRIMICTHATIAQAFSQIVNTNDIKDIYLWIDEAHHVAASDIFCNELGDVVKYFIKHSNDGLNIGLVTATPSRGDNFPILNQSNENDFYVYKLPHDKHFEQDCQYIKSFIYDFILSQKGWGDSIKTLFNKEIGKTIITIPHPNMVVSNGKFLDVKMILSAIANEENPEVREGDNGETIVKRNGKDVVVIDLVDDRNEYLRAKRVEFIRNYPDDFDVILNISVFQEGGDWPNANRSIIVGNRNSLTQMVQIISRIFRDHISKKDKPVEIYQVLPWIDLQSLDKIDTRENINNYMKGVYASLIIESLIDPPNINIQTTITSNKNTNGKNTTVSDFLMSVMGETSYIYFINEAIDKLIEYRANNLDIPNKLVANKYKEILIDFFENSDIEEFSEYFNQIIDFIIALLKKRTKSILNLNSSVSASQINFDIIEEKDIDPIGFVLGYTNEVCGINSLRDFRNVINIVEGIWNENYNKLNAFVKKYGRFPERCSLEINIRFLGSWVNHQRQSYKKNKLSQNQIKMLEQIPGWKWRRDSEKMWNKQYDKLITFIEKNKAFPSDKSKDADERYVGQWKVNQKGYKKQNKLSEEQIKMLEQIPEWQWKKDTGGEIWTNHYYKLINYIEIFGIYPSVCSIEKKIKSLGLWAATQRQNYKQNKLSQEQIKMLEQIPKWKWKINSKEIRSENWIKNYYDFINYIKTFGKYPSENSKESKFLNSWMENQKRNYRKNKLSEYQKKMLEQIPGWTLNPKSDNWNNIYNKLKEYKEKNHSFPTQYSKEKDVKSIGLWYSRQKENYYKNILSQERINLLEQIQGWTW